MLRINSRWRGAHGAWAEGLKARPGPNIAAVALANKNARVAWKLLSTGERQTFRQSWQNLAELESFEQPHQVNVDLAHGSTSTVVVAWNR